MVRVIEAGEELQTGESPRIMSRGERLPCHAGSLVSEDVLATRAG
ncbi:MAG: hypothetical protein OXU19_11115 [bacterium]|nr:hypothetical protein [bacterium]